MIPAIALLKGLTNEQVCGLLKGFHDMLDNKDEIQSSIKKRFPEIFATTRRTNDDHRDDGKREDVFCRENTELA